MDLDVEKIVQAIQNSNKIVVVAGAGISVSCGIPDFRSPECGLYDNLQSYNLPMPTMMFLIDYFRRRPRPFYKLIGNLFPEKPYQPSITHYFLALLQQKGKLLEFVTQNIDDLESRAGMDQPIQAHGSFMRYSYCVSCRKRYPSLTALAASLDDAIPYCTCGGVIKPSVVFFGEAVEIPTNRIARASRQADLCMVMGTSLNVAPVSQIPTAVSCPRVLVNRELVGDFSESDMLWLGDCDDFSRKIADKLGWTDDLNKLIESKADLNATWGDYKAPLDQQTKLVMFEGELVIPTALKQTIQQRTVMFGLSTDEQIERLRQSKTVTCEEMVVARDDVPREFTEMWTEKVFVFSKNKASGFYAPLDGHYCSYVTKFVDFQREDDSWDQISRKTSQNKLGQWMSMIGAFVFHTSTDVQVANTENIEGTRVVRTTKSKVAKVDEE